MKLAADFRSMARNALTGRWTIAVIVGLIASLLGGAATSGIEVSLNTGDSEISLHPQIGQQTVYNFSYDISEQLAEFLANFGGLIILAALIVAAVFLILGSVINVGYCQFNLDLTGRQKEPQIDTLFHYFSYWKTTTSARLLQGLYVFLWSLLLIVPGIMASYSYAMTSYILAQQPELTAGEALERSKAMMYGNRRRLFCLQLSFIGWDLLAALTMGIGNLWLTPYKQAATAAFYQDISGISHVPPVEDPPPFIG